MAHAQRQHANAADALAALRRARAEGDPYHFALLDYQMPEMDGAALGCREQCLAAGMNHHIPKPVKMEFLFEAIRRWVPAKQPAAVS